MTRHVLLDNINYKDLKIITERSAKYGDNVASVITYPFEFRDIQAHYPICFSKNPDNDDFHAIALLGFEEGENLFLNSDNWDANYIPLMLKKGPFLIGFSQQKLGEEQREPFIYFDEDSPRVSTTIGEPVFLEHGGNSQFLQQIIDVLQKLHHGHQGNKIFFEQLTQFDLLEKFTLEVTLNDGSFNKLQGLYTINEEKLNALNNESKIALFDSGSLAAIYMVLASISNFSLLIEKKNGQIETELSE